MTPTDCGSVTCLSQYYRRNRAFMIGLSATGASIAGIIYPIMLRQLFVRIGFPWAIRIFGFLIFALVGVGTLTLRPRYVGRNHGPLFDLTPFRDPVFCLLVFGGVCPCCTTAELRSARDHSRHILPDLSDGQPGAARRHQRRSVILHSVDYLGRVNPWATWRPAPRGPRWGA